jgi:hypothetical protein
MGDAQAAGPPVSGSHGGPAVDAEHPEPLWLGVPDWHAVRMAILGTGPPRSRWLGCSRSVDGAPSCDVAAMAALVRQEPTDAFALEVVMEDEW